MSFLGIGGIDMDRIIGGYDWYDTGSDTESPPDYMEITCEHCKYNMFTIRNYRDKTVAICTSCNQEQYICRNQP